jgi:hypothetical protein
MVLLSQKAWAAKVSMPILSIAVYILCLVSVRSVEQLFYSALLFSPVLAIGAWLLFVPAQIEAHEGEPFFTVIRWRSSTQIPISEIDSIQRQISIFDTLRLKSGAKILYIADAGNRYLRSQIRKDRVDQAT